MQHVLLRTIGRRSGNEHKVALPFWRDPDGHRIIVASFAGAPKDPAWFLNLSDQTANPEVLVRVQGGLFWADAQILAGADYCGHLGCPGARPPALLRLQDRDRPP